MFSLQAETSAQYGFEAEVSTEMLETTPILLWRRIIEALRQRNGLIEGSPKEVAAHARSVLGNDLVDRFLNGYFLERQYGGGSGQLSDAAAEELVRQVENLPIATPAAPRQKSAQTQVVMA